MFVPVKITRTGPQWQLQRATTYEDPYVGMLPTDHTMRQQQSARRRCEKYVELTPHRIPMCKHRLLEGSFVEVLLTGQANRGTVFSVIRPLFCRPIIGLAEKFFDDAFLPRLKGGTRSAKLILLDQFLKGLLYFLTTFPVVVIRRPSDACALAQRGHVARCGRLRLTGPRAVLHALKLVVRPLVAPFSIKMDLARLLPFPSQGFESRRARAILKPETLGSKLRPYCFWVQNGPCALSPFRVKVLSPGARGPF